MKMPDEPSARPALPRVASPQSYGIHPLAALDGVLIYAETNGETVGFYFGQDERAAAAKLAGDVAHRALATTDGAKS